MSKTGYHAFDTTVDKTNRMLREIEEACGWSHERRNQSYGALRAVLHTLRDRLTVQESAQLAAQLPMLVRGMYYDGWDPGAVPKKMKREEFLARVRAEVPYELPGGPEALVHAVLEVLERHTSPGEWRGIRAGLPKDLVSLLP